MTNYASSSVVPREAWISGGDELAKAASMGQPKISKLETGRQLPTAQDIQTLTGPLGLSQRTARELLDDAEQLRPTFARWPSGGASLLAEQRAAGEIERDAAEMTAVQPLVVPGLLQTPEYAHEIFARVSLDPDAGLRLAVRARLERQRILTSTGRRFTFVVLETLCGCGTDATRSCCVSFAICSSSAPGSTSRLRSCPCRECCPSCPNMASRSSTTAWSAWRPRAGRSPPTAVRR
jgi:transcriptional regulator with XRE-family HTH domain